MYISDGIVIVSNSLHLFRSENEFIRIFNEWQQNNSDLSLWLLRQLGIQ